MSESDVPGSSDTPTQDLGSARRAAGLSRRELARRSGVPKRTIAAIERGTCVASTEQSAAIASACADASIAPPEAPVLDPVATTVAPDDTVALDDLLREYIAMVVELRSTTVESFGSLRVEDLTVLAGALGSSPETIEARIMELLGTEASRASEMRGAILPSTTSLHRPLFTT